MTEHFDAGTLAMAREGLLDDTEAARVRAHLAACALCRQEDAQLGFVTQILATAPAPPMPPDLSARIEAALAAEAAARSAGPVAGGIAAADATQPGTGQPGTALPGLEQPRMEPADSRPGAVRPGPAAARNGAPVPVRAGRRGGRGAGPGPGDGRPPPRALRSLTRSRAMLRTMAAAAVIVVAGGGGYALSQVLGQGSAGPQSSGASSAGAPAVPSPMQHGAAGLQQNSSPSAPKITVFPVSSGTNYTRQKFASQLSATLNKYPASSMGHRASSAAHALPGSTLSSCVQAVTKGRQPQLVDLARYQGRPAMIIVVAASSQGPGHAWVVSRDCSAASPGIRAQYPVPRAGP